MSQLDHLKQELTAISENQWEIALRETYQQFEIMDNQGHWQSPLIEAHAKMLWPTNFKTQGLNGFLDDIEESLAENPYFNQFISALTQSEQSFSFFNPLPGAQNTRLDFLRYLIAFAYCLDKINLAMRDDLAFLESIITLYQRIRRQRNFYRFGNLMPIIKLHSIELPLVQFLRARKRNHVGKNFGKYILSFNIFEAALVDLALGFRANARATLPLIFFSPNFSFLKKFKSGAPSSFSPDGKACWMTSPGQKEWSDLYQVWNMAFVSQFHLAPFLLAKLMVPSVSRYAHRPSEYMHTRITALHLAMHFLDFAISTPKLSVDLKMLGACSLPVTQTWGKINQIAAQQYVQTITVTP